MTRWLLYCAIAVLLDAVVCGCGSNGPKKYPVSGTVTLNGQALSDGDIVFEPLDQQYGGDAGKIQGGEFALQAVEGKSRVLIRAAEFVPKRGNPNAEPDSVSLVPPKYNDQTVLEAEVRKSGENRYVFELITP